MVHYVKDAFLNGRVFADFADLNTQARHWLTCDANTRIHATTQQRPIDLWPRDELERLDSVARYRLYERVPRKAGFDGFVRFEKSRYSLPPEHAGQTVLIGREDHKIIIRVGDMIVAEHEAAHKPGTTIADPSHIAALWKLSLQKTKTPLPRWQLTFDHQVQNASLLTYQETIQ